MSFFNSKPAEAPAVETPDSTEVLALRSELSALRRSQAVIEFNLDGTILTANDNFLNALGYTLKEIEGQHHRIFVPPADAALPEYQMFWRRLGAGEFDAGEYRRIAKDGTEIWIQASYNPVFDETGKPIKVIKYAADITKRKVEQAGLRGMVEAISTSQAVIEFELDGTIVKANEHFLAATGYKLEEIQGQHHRMFCDPNYTESLEYKHFWKKLAAGDYESGQFKRFGKGGRAVWIQATYNPILDASGRPVRVVKIASDITAQIETKEKAAQMGEAVASSVTEMVATIEEIARNVSQTAVLAQDAEGVATLTGSHVSSLGDSSRKIGEVVGVIQELADQTNLLALNATIEAARAGESGRSFAVVASEVKELANATANATQNIEDSVREIQDSIVKVVESTDKITAGISEVSSNTTTVAAAIEEQSATMSGLGDTASELKSITAGA